MYDCIIVGGGLAGLHTAYRLERDMGWKQVLVLEARDRVGGRTWTQPIPSMKHVGMFGYFDYGGTWIGPNQKRILALCKKFHIQLYEQFDLGTSIALLNKKKYQYAGNLSEMADEKDSKASQYTQELDQAVAHLERLSEQINVHSLKDTPHAKKWDSITMEAWEQEHLKLQESKDILNIVIRTIYATEPEQLSLLVFLYYLKQGHGYASLADVKEGAQNFKVHGGTQQISIRLADALTGPGVMYNSPVCKVSYHSNKSVQVYTTDRVYQARRCVMAIPPNLLAQMTFSPPLPHQQRFTYQRMPMGSTTKAYILYDRAWWRDAKFSGEVICPEDTPFALYYDSSLHLMDANRKLDPLHRVQPALVGFACANATWKFDGLSYTEKVDAITAQLYRLFQRKEALSPSHVYFATWSEETYSKGCYVSLPAVGSAWTLDNAYRQPLENTVFFTGTEFATDWIGYMEGALESSENTVKQILTTTGRNAKL